MAVSAASIARRASLAPAFATRPTGSPEYGDLTSTHSPVSTHSPSINSLRSGTVMAMCASLVGHFGHRDSECPMRGGVGVTYWLLIRGRGERPLDRQIDPAHIRTQRSTKRPSVAAGDRAILYASVWQAIFGVAEVVGEPEKDPGRSR